MGSRTSKPASTNTLSLPGIDLETCPRITQSQLDSHNTPGDCWVAIHGYVFEVTKFLPDHPGGAQLISGLAGRDVSEHFEINNHSQTARNMLIDMFKGVLVIQDENIKAEKQAVEVKEVQTEKKELEKKEDVVSKEISEVINLKVFYGTQKGTAKKFAEQLVSEAISKGIIGSGAAIDLAKYEPEDFASEKDICIFIMATYTDGKPTENALFFTNWLTDACSDFRYTHHFLNQVRYSIFGLADSQFIEFNKTSILVDSLLQKGGAFRFFANGVGDNNAARETGTQVDDFETWKKMLFTILPTVLSTPITGTCCNTNNESSCCSTKDSNTNSGQCCSSAEDGKESGSCCKNNVEEDDYESDEGSDAPFEQDDTEEVVDMEDLASAPKAAAGPFTREMVTPTIRASLTKQGYRILGSHSGVKLCRWNKAMLRGRGGCYKHTFYGILSYCCMEMTPNLSCANKCVFCWRHHSNPVGKEWKWVVDEPEFLIENAIEQHISMIKQMKGVPGVRKECFEEAMTVKHCALSLVGEPIMYPHINRFVSMLHERHISTFMVTNAQFPDCIRDLTPVTQLYISVDAATPETLKAIDRPLFQDYWKRFTSSMDELAKKPCRTVYRLTLVKSYNMEELPNYASLIARGQPDFIEIKGVTFCGNNDASNLTMQNVPYHQEVVNFANAILSYISNDYELSCEHAHSCCLLISHKKFKIDNKWHTWINYPKFFELAKSGLPFKSTDYAAETPEWAVYGHESGGFDPEQERVAVKGVKKRLLKEAQSQASAQADLLEEF